MIDQYEIAERIVDAGYGSGAIGIYKSEVAKILQDRIGGLCADHKAFLYLRIHDLHKQHHLGGGNITSAFAAFSAISLLSKVCYFIDKPRRFTPTDGVYFKVNETDAFCHFIKLLANNDILLGVSKDDAEAQKFIWSGFRNYLAHLGTAEHGKRVVTFEFKQPTDKQDITDLGTKIDDMLEWQIFQDDGTGRNWQVYIDTLFAKLEKIILPFVVAKVIGYAVDDDRAARNLYKLVSGEKDLP